MLHCRILKQWEFDGLRLNDLSVDEAAVYFAAVDGEYDAINKKKMGGGGGCVCWWGRHIWCKKMLFAQASVCFSPFVFVEIKHYFYTNINILYIHEKNECQDMF